MEPKEPLVVVDLQFRVQPALNERLDAALLHQLVDFLQDLLVAEQVALRVVRRAIKRAELAAHPAHIRVVDDAPDDIGDIRVGVFAHAHGVRQCAQRGQVRIVEQRDAVFKRQPLACQHLLGDGFKARLTRYEQAFLT
jgi:hypothetical protein